MKKIHIISNENLQAGCQKNFYILNNSMHKQIYIWITHSGIRQRMLHIFYATNLTPKKLTVFIYAAYFIRSIFSVYIILFVILTFSDCMLFQIYGSIYMLHYELSKILVYYGLRLSSDISYLAACKWLFSLMRQLPFNNNINCHETSQII